LSPYSYLAVARIAQDRALSSIPLDLRPVVLGTVWSRLGVKGPGEIPARRRQALVDVSLLAQQYGLPLEGPPAHPFNSIYALRSVAAIADPELRFALTERYFRAAWGDGESLEDLAVLRRCLAELGVAQDPEEAATQAAQRTAVKGFTAELLAAGGWGVPTFQCRGVLLFGHDRLPLLAALHAGAVAPDLERIDRLLARPQGARLT
jgi:2-hydroxychromene-2-carboxylate isomerase